MGARLLSDLWVSRRILNCIQCEMPVQFLEDRGDVFSGAGVGEQAGSGVLNVLVFFFIHRDSEQSFQRER